MAKIGNKITKKTDKKAINVMRQPCNDSQIKNGHK